MSWFILILGVSLWWAAHLFKRLAPARRGALGDAGKGAVALALVAAVVLMVVGFRAAPFVPVWQPPAFAVHINNLLMLVAIYLFSPAAKRGKLIHGMRHPMLTGFATWAIAHLLVNGDLASILMFGGLLLWVPVAIVAINRAEPGWQPPATEGKLALDAAFAAGSVVLLVVIGYVHNWLGYWPFPG